MLPEPILVLAKLATIFDELGIAYLVGGSIASSVYGIPRATQDVDLVADFRSHHVVSFVDRVAPDFYADESMIREAIEARGSFNVIHLETMFKADVFILKDDDWSREEMRRTRTEEFATTAGPVQIRFASPEDTLLHKLVWYRLGGHVSDRQWGDIRGVLQIQGTALDSAHLDQWAAVLGVTDLLLRARRQMG